MNYTTYYLQFTSPLHLGNHRPEGYETSESILHSDTIAAAILSAWAKMGHSDWIEECSGNPKWTVSSAFPFAISPDGVRHHFFPKPMFRLEFEGSEGKDQNIAKEVKRLEWLDQPYFEKAIACQLLPKLGVTGNRIKGNLLTDADWIQSAFTRESHERVKVPRDYINNKDATPFVMERLRFENGCGLYFLVDNDDKQLNAALEFLQYEGLGTDRNVGNGYFELHKSELTISVPDNADMHMCLGLYCPDSKEILNKQLTDQSSYQITRRGGWITSHEGQGLEKHGVYMFIEGSIFAKIEKATDQYVFGLGNIDLTPAVMENVHKVYRNGRTIFIPVKKEI